MALNALTIKPGAKVRLNDGSIAEVTENPRDGYWLTCRFVSSPSDPSLEGTEEMIVVTTVAEVIEET